MPNKMKPERMWAVQCTTHGGKGWFTIDGTASHTRKEAMRQFSPAKEDWGRARKAGYRIAKIRVSEA